MHGEHVRTVTAGRVVLGQFGDQFRGDGIDVAGDRLPGVVAGDDQPGEVLVEQIADDLDQDVGLLVEGHRRPGLIALDPFGLLGDLGPAFLQPGDVGADVVFLDALRCGTDDNAGLGGHDLAQDLLEPLPFVVGEFAADAGRRRPRHVDQVTAGQRDLCGQAGALVTDGVLADLNHDVVARLEGLLDLAVGPAESGGLPVDLARVEHAVAAAADVDERRLHRGQHVLHDAQVDVADQRRRTRRGHEVLDDNAVFEDRDLGVARTLVRRFGADLVAHHHHPVDRLPAGQELGFGQYRRAAPAGIAAVAAALALGFQTGGAADALDLVGLGAGLLLARGTLVNDGVRRVVR